MKRAQEAGDMNSRLPGGFEHTVPQHMACSGCWGEATWGVGARLGSNKRELKTADQPQTGKLWVFSGEESPGTVS